MRNTQKTEIAENPIPHVRNQLFYINRGQKAFLRDSLKRAHHHQLPYWILSKYPYILYGATWIMVSGWYLALLVWGS